MIRSMKWLFLGGLVAAGMVVAVGCEGRGRPPIDTSALVGSWIELADQSAANPRVQSAGAKKKHFRHLVLNADQTFEFTLRTKAGKPTKNKIEGTWAIEENELVFTVTNSTFPSADERSDWAPESSVGIQKKNIAGQGFIDVFTIVDKSGMPTAYVHAE